MDTIDRKVKQTTGEATDRIQERLTQAAENLRDCQAAILSATQANINAMFEYVQDAFSAKSMPELIELSTKYARRQMEMMSEQAREIATATQKAAVESARPLTGFADKIGRMS